jgi:hypothetical protein
MRRPPAPLLLLALVPVSSVLGLARPMVQLDGWGLFVDVWKANLWGDLAFTAGTVLAGWAAARLVRRLAAAGWPAWGCGLAAVPASFLLHWAVYAVSWSFTGNASDSAAHAGQRFLAWTFGRFGDAWGFTFSEGWIGLVACAILVPLAAGWALAQEREAVPGAAAPQPPPA